MLSAALNNFTFLTQSESLSEELLRALEDSNPGNPMIGLRESNMYDMNAGCVAAFRYTMKILYWVKMYICV